MACSPIPDGNLRVAYNRAIHWDRRKQIAEEWATLLMDGQVPAVELLIPQR